MTLKSTKCFHRTAKKLRNAICALSICIAMFFSFSSNASEGSNALFNTAQSSSLIPLFIDLSEGRSYLAQEITDLGLASIFKVIREQLKNLFINMDVEGSSLIMNANIVSLDYSNVAKKLHPNFKISFDYRYGHDAQLPKNFFDGSGTIGSSSNSASLNMSLNFF